MTAHCLGKHDQWLHIALASMTIGDVIFLWYSRGQTKTTIFLNHFGMSDKCSDYILKRQNSTLGIQWTDPYEPIFEKCPFEKLYPKNIGHTLNAYLKSWKKAQSTPFLKPRLMVHFPKSSTRCDSEKNWIKIIIFSWILLVSVTWHVES